MKVGSDDQILGMSPHPPISTSDAQGLIKKTAAEVNEMGTISYKNIEYPLPENSKELRLFHCF